MVFSFSFFLLKEGVIAYSADRSTPQQYASSTPSSELDHISQCDGAGGTPDMGPGTENQLLASLLPNMVQPMQSVQLMPSGQYFESLSLSSKDKKETGFQHWKII